MSTTCKSYGTQRYKMINENLSEQYVQVIVSIEADKVPPVFTIDPWDNCPCEAAKEEGRFCNECEWWGRVVEGYDWSELSLCLFDGEGEQVTAREQDWMRL